MKQTAVEWLVQALIISEDSPNYNQWAIEKAKAMEKEQMCSFAEFVATYHDKNQNYLGEMLHAKSKYDGAERTVDLLETFKSE
jgi:hypothetical protein